MLSLWCIVGVFTLPHIFELFVYLGLVITDTGAFYLTVWLLWCMGMPDLLDMMGVLFIRRGAICMHTYTSKIMATGLDCLYTVLVPIPLAQGWQHLSPPPEFFWSLLSVHLGSLLGLQTVASYTGLPSLTLCVHICKRAPTIDREVKLLFNCHLYEISTWLLPRTILCSLHVSRQIRSSIQAESDRVVVKAGLWTGP